MSPHERFGGKPPGPIVQAKMMNSARRMVTLLVEAGVDKRFWQIYVDQSTCLIEDQGQGGRAAALKKLADALAHNVPFLAILDADLDRLEKRLQTGPGFEHVIWTDGHDLETTLVFLPGLVDKLVSAHVMVETLDKKLSCWEESFQTRLVRHAVGMGRLRWYKERNKGQSNFSDFRFGKEGKGSSKGELVRFAGYEACCGPDWAPALDRVVGQLINYNNAQGRLKVDEVLAGVRALEEGANDQVCNGHDLLGFLLVGIQHAANKRESGLTVEGLQHEVCLACERVWLEKTAMWQGVLAWQARSGYRVLRA